MIQMPELELLAYHAPHREQIAQVLHIAQHAVILMPHHQYLGNVGATTDTTIHQLVQL